MYKHGTYFLFPSIISIKSSSLASHFKLISALLILYSLKIAYKLIIYENTFIVSSSNLGASWVLVIVIPPLSLFLYSIWGGYLFNLIPNPSNSLSIIFLWIIGLVASKTIKIKLHVLATAITYFPLPLPSLAPSIIPGKSNNCILAPLCIKTYSIN